MPGPGTTPTQIRLTEADKAKIKDLCTWYGLPSIAAAIRLAIESKHAEGRPRGRKKNPKNPGEGP